MENQDSFLEIHDPQKDEIIFYTEDDIPICIDSENLIVFDCNEENVNFGNDGSVVLDDLKVQVIHTANIPLTSDPLKISKCCPRNKKSPKRWRQKEVTIKTIESEFKVVMWVLTDNDQNEKVETKPFSKKNQEKIDQEPIVSPIKQKLKTSQLSQHKALPSKRCSIKSCRDPENSNVPNTLEYLCTFQNCKKNFKDASSLRKHLHTHGPKTKVCAECGKAFIDNSKLNRHLVVHTGDKPYKCWFSGCGKSFSLDFNLRTHARIHTGYRPFACTFDGCNKRFAQSTNLKSHQKIHLKRMQIDKGSDIFM